MPDLREHNKMVISAFRASSGHGELGPIHFERMVLLTTRGRHSGEPHTAPLGYVEDAGGNVVLFASNMGAPTDPDWYRNIQADPHVTIELTDSSRDAVATIPTGRDRDAAYELWVGTNPHVAGHQEQAGRQIPMVLIPPP